MLRPPSEPASQSFFKLFLCFFARLGMRGSRHQVAPPMPSQQAVHRAVIDLVSNSCLKSPLDFRCGGNLPGFGTRPERCQELPFLFQAQLGVPTASLARCLNCTHSKAVVERDDLMHRRLGDSAMFGNFFCFARINQGVLDNEPALSAPSTRIVLQPIFHFLNGYMSGCACDSCHAFPLVS